MKKTVTDWVRPEIQKLSAYAVHEAGNAIKLDAMENPYHWDTALTEEWLNYLKTAAINRYPDPGARQVKKQFRELLQLPDNMELILGNGSDELIQMLALTLNGEGHVILAPEPSFVMYRLVAQCVGMQYVSVPLQAKSFTLDMFAMLEAIDTYQPALIFLSYPNNPTGNAFAVADIEAIIETTSGVVVIDEAYAPFTDKTFLPRLSEYPNLLVMRTVSKLGLAGIRLGLLAGSSEWLQQLEKTRLPYNINVLTQLTAEFALQHYHVLEAQTRQIRVDREQLLKHLNAINGVHAWVSEANFILFRVADAFGVFNKLKSKGILIKCLHSSHPLLSNCLRVTVGTAEENQAFLKVLSDIM